MNEHVISPSRVSTPSDVRSRVEAIFTPASPVTRRDLLAGRAQALQQLLELIQQPGRHAVVFGERGVGKTSLAMITPEFSGEPAGVVRVCAAAADSFDSLWRRTTDAVRTSLRRAERGLGSASFPIDTPTRTARTGAASQAEVLELLAKLSSCGPAWIVFDDFERVTDTATRHGMRAIAEATAAAAPAVTLVFVGTAANGDALMDSSAALVPVQVSRLGADERVEAIARLLRPLGLAADDAVLGHISTLSNGLPQSIQSLAREAALAAFGDGERRIEVAHLDAAVRAVLADAPSAVRASYEQATVRARRGIYPEILLACALAPRDAQGTFSVATVCESVTRIVRREVRGLTNQVSALTEEGRGAVLDKLGAAKTARYRFVDPSLEPYILMRGLEEGWTTHRTLSWLPGLPEAMELPKAA